MCVVSVVFNVIALLAVEPSAQSSNTLDLSFLFLNQVSPSPVQLFSTLTIVPVPFAEKHQRNASTPPCFTVEMVLSR